MRYKWVPILGEFDVRDKDIKFKGKSVELQSQSSGELSTDGGQPPTMPQIGLLLSDQQMSDGIVSADIMFDEITDNSSCEIILAYDVHDQSMLTAGLGGNLWAMYTIRQWIPPSPLQKGQWNGLDQSGTRSNMRAGITYHLDANIKGSLIQLKLDGVQVASATLASPQSRPRQVGLWCADYKDITVTNFTVDAERPKAFIIMQFSSPYDEVYSAVIKGACDECNLDALRADEMYGPGIIIKDVTDKIAKSHVIIADISPTNPNVYFEVGYALALQKPIILLAQKETPLPFDVSAFRVLFYEDSIAGKARIEQGLKNHLKAILQQR